MDTVFPNISLNLTRRCRFSLDIFENACLTSVTLKDSAVNSLHVGYIPQLNDTNKSQ